MPTIPGILSDLFFPLQEKAFSFTFVRNPLERFISAYIEIEKTIKKSAIVDLAHPVGTYDRFLEFINIILIANASKKLFLLKDIDFLKVSPMIGTLSLGIQLQRRGWNRFRVYRLENFDEDWASLTSDSGFTKLAILGEDMGREHHHQIHADFRNITAVIKEFFSPVLAVNHSKELEDFESTLTHGKRKGNETGFHISRKRAQKHELAYFYLRAFCRIYLIDYVCAGYELPIACRDMHSDIRAVLTEREKKAAAKRHFGWDFVVPVFFKEALAYLYCFSSVTPQCHAEYMKYDDFLPEEDLENDDRGPRGEL
jgi:hypothetical protein